MAHVGIEEVWSEWSRREETGVSSALWEQAVDDGDWDEAKRIAERRQGSAPATGGTALKLIRITEPAQAGPATFEPRVSRYGDPSTENPE